MPYVNLAGAGIGDGRWGLARRRAIIHSRIVRTRRLVEAMRHGGPSALINGSAFGYYGPGDYAKDETAVASDDLLARVGLVSAPRKEGVADRDLQNS